MRDYLRLIRWENLLFLGILIWGMEKWICTPILNTENFYEVLPWWVLWLIILATVCTAAAGYIINDYFDIKIDRINCPDRLIISQTISKEQAMKAYRITAGIGIGLGLIASWVVRSLPLATIFLIVPGLLWFYSSTYKRQFLIGNIIVAFVSALSPMLVALANVAWLDQHFSTIMPYLTVGRDIVYWITGFAVFAFLTTLIREIIKDFQDQMGDRELECHSLPIVLGETWSKIIVTVLILLTVSLLSYTYFATLPMPHTWNSFSLRYLVFGILIPLISILWFLWKAHISSDYKHTQLLMKFIMFLGMLFAFVIGHYLDI